MEVFKKEEDIYEVSSPFSEVLSDSDLPKLTSVQGRTSGPTRRSTKGGWTEQEDAMLTKAVKLFNGKNWKKIAECFPGRSDVQCLHRWQKVLNPDLVKGPWTKEEDDRIVELVNRYGFKKWSVIAQSLPGRIGKQCRERWHNHLNPAIKKHAWTKEEEIALIRAHQIYGNKWAEIAKFLPGRADNSIKNHWNCSVKKKLDSYLASGYSKDMLGINGYDFYNHDSKEEPMKPDVSNSDSGMICSLHQMDSDDEIDTSLGVSVLGVANTRKKDRHSHLERKRSIARDLSSGLCGEDDNYGGESVDYPDNSPGHPETISLSMSTMSGSRMCESRCVSTKRIPESPKRPRHYASPLHESRCMNLFPDLSCESPKQTNPDIFLRSGRFSNSPVCCSPPPSQTRSIYSNGSSPETILRIAAKNFKNTPSIIRKRTHVHETPPKQDFSGSSNGSCDNVLDVKWLSLSSPGLETETGVPLKSVEKRLEYAFDLEWDDAKAKSGNSTTEIDPIADNVETLDSSNQNFMLLGFGINCNL